MIDCNRYGLYRRLDPLTGISVFMIFLGFTGLVSVPASFLESGGVISAGITLLVVAMLRRSTTSAGPQLPGPRRLSLRDEFPSHRRKAPTLTEQLAQLSDLRLMGALSDDEFDRAKAILLDPH